MTTDELTLELRGGGRFIWIKTENYQAADINGWR